MELNKRIEQLLLEKNGGNKSELARFCNVTPQAVQQWIEGTTAPRGKRLNSIAAFFGMTEVELVYGVRPMPLPVKPYKPRSAKDVSPEALRIAKAFDRLTNPAQRAAVIAQLEAFGVLDSNR
jgi:transcriptional regulator with XRE-family HTH domain